MAVKTIANIPAAGFADSFCNWVPVVGQHTCLKVYASQQLGEISGGNNSAQENVFDFQAAGASPADPLFIKTRLRCSYRSLCASIAQILANRGTQVVVRALPKYNEICSIGILGRDTTHIAAPWQENCTDLFPAGRRIVGHDDPNRLYFVDLAAPDLVDVHGRHVEGPLVGHVGLLPVRVAGDLELLLRHRMPEV